VGLAFDDQPVVHADHRVAGGEARDTGAERIDHTCDVPADAEGALRRHEARVGEPALGRRRRRD
jgi:hypothetical protein